MNKCHRATRKWIKASIKRNVSGCLASRARIPKYNLWREGRAFRITKVCGFQKEGYRWKEYKPIQQEATSSGDAMSRDWDEL